MMPITPVAATPERVVNAKRFIGKLEKLYKAGRLARIAVDEVASYILITRLLQNFHEFY